MEPDWSYYVSITAAAAIEAIAVAKPPPGNRVLVVVFGPAADDWPSVYSNAEVRQLVPLLQSMLAKLVGGGLVRLPPTDGVRWIDADDPPAGGE